MLRRFCALVVAVATLLAAGAVSADPCKQAVQEAQRLAGLVPAIDKVSDKATHLELLVTVKEKDVFYKIEVECKKDKEGWRLHRVACSQHATSVKWMKVWLQDKEADKGPATVLEALKQAVQAGEKDKLAGLFCAGAAGAGDEKAGQANVDTQVGSVLGLKKEDAAAALGHFPALDKLHASVVAVKVDVRTGSKKSEKHLAGFCKSDKGWQISLLSLAGSGVPLRQAAGSGARASAGGDEAAAPQDDEMRKKAVMGFGMILIGLLMGWVLGRKWSARHPEQK